jgi:hypothetical protein
MNVRGGKQQIDGVNVCGGPSGAVVEGSKMGREGDFVGS